MFIGLSEYAFIEDNTILYPGDSGIQFNTYEWISIISNTVNYSYTYPISTTNYGVSNGEMIGNMIAHYSGIQAACIALQAGGHENFTITDNYFEGQWGGLFTVAPCWGIDFNRNYAVDMGQYLIGLQSGEDCNIINNTLVNSAQWGIYTTLSHRTNIIGNELNTTAATALYVGGVNITVLNNSVYEASTGMHLQSTATYAIAQYNTLESCNTAIDVDSDDATIDSNVILDSDNGIDVSSGSVRINITNNVIDGVGGAAIQLRASDQLVSGNTISNSDMGISVNTVTGFELRENIIDSSGIAIYFYNSLDGEIAYNNMTDCGVFFNLGSTIPQLNHTFEENYVNDKPMFFGFEDHSETLSGDGYGEIILVNCSDAAINGGLFSMSSVAMQLFYSDRADITGIGVMDQNTGITIEFSDNVTISDSIFSAHIGDEALYVDNTLGFTAHNITMHNINKGLKLSESSNFSVVDSDFSGIGEFAIRVNTGQYGLFQGNTIFNVTYGIDISGVQDSLIDNNEISFTDRGINAWGESDNNNATFNNIHENGYGILMDDSFSWFIYNNTLRWNAYGLYMTTTNDDATIFNNTFALSTYDNGFCDGADQWDDHVDGGNYWDDYSGSGVYNVPGGGGAVDNYPIQYIVYKPIINSPLDFSYAEGSEGNFITWVPFDNNLKDWVVNIDDAEWASDAWNFENITVNVDGLPYGVHTIFVLVEDLVGNTVNDTVIVTVYDDTVPEIHGPPDTWLFEGGADQTISWLVSDLNPNDYKVFVDGALFETGSWTTGVLTIDFEGVTEGLHKVNVTIYDADGNAATDILMFLMISDSDNPTIAQPEDVIYLVGTTGNAVVWTPEDEFADRYEVTFNGTPYKEGEWSGSRINVNVDGFPVGIYEVTITVFDTSGNSATDTVNVTVLPLIPPEIPITFDWLLVILVAVGVGAVAVVIVIIYLMKKRSPSN